MMIDSDRSRTKQHYIEEKRRAYFSEWLTISFQYGLLFLLGPIALDYAAVPEHFKTFLAYRILTAIVLSILLIFHKKSSSLLRQSVIGLCAVTTVSVMLSAMILKFHGHQSPYTMGILVLVIFGFAALPFWAFLFASAAVYGTYIVPLLLFDTITNVPFFLSMNVLMLSCIVALLLLRYLGNKRLLHEFSLQYDIEQYQGNLETLVEERTKLLSKTVANLKDEIGNRERIEVDLRKSTEAVESSKAQYEQVVSMISDTVWRYEVNDRGEVVSTYISPVVEKLLNLPSGSIGNSFEKYFSYVHPEDLPGIQEAFFKGIRLLEKDVSREYRLRTSDGRVRWVRSGGSAHRQPDGTVIAIGITSDITDRKEAEQERLKTQKLEALGTLAGGIAHDFNNLLQGVFGYISLAKMAPGLSGEGIDHLDQAEKALHQSVGLTNQLLTFSKGGKPIKKGIDLRPLVENTARFTLSGARSGYHFVSDDGLWQTEADEGQIGQVIQNIVLNADQSMSEGGRIEIAAKNVVIPHESAPQGLPTGNYVAIAVTDSGKGIPEHFVGRIFDPYFTTKEKGSGLGLATAYSIIKNHGGMIDVKSETNKGSTFTIYIPAIKSVPMPRAHLPEAESVGPLRILLMDDDPMVLTVAGALIRALGHSVESAADGTEALEMYRRTFLSGDPFDIVILDVTVRGGMGGSETIVKLRKIDPGVKAIVSSGYSDDSATANYLDAGFRTFLKKPYNAEKLRDAIAAVMR
jgi:signal transduction histidine kinase/CheY-like chemotaxis protein/cell division protein FtsB